MKGFWIAFAATAISLSALGIVSLFTVDNTASPMWALGILYLAALVTAVVLAVRKQTRAAAGMFAGMGAGALVFMTSCFVIVFATL